MGCEREVGCFLHHKLYRIQLEASLFKFLHCLSITMFSSVSLLMSPLIQVMLVASVAPRHNWSRYWTLTFNRYSIMMLMKFADLSQTDRSNWVMWQVKHPCPRPGWDGVWPGKIVFHKMYKNLDDIAVCLTTFLRSKWNMKKQKTWIAGYDNCFLFVF